MDGQWSDVIQQRLINFNCKRIVTIIWMFLVRIML